MNTDLRHEMDARVTRLARQGRQEIRADIAGGIVPRWVANFAELHDYVDANEYGDLCEEWVWSLPYGYEIAVRVQDRLDRWIKRGGHRRGRPWRTSGAAY